MLVILEHYKIIDYEQSESGRGEVSARPCLSVDPDLSGRSDQPERVFRTDDRPFEMRRLRPLRDHLPVQDAFVRVRAGSDLFSW